MNLRSGIIIIIISVLAGACSKDFLDTKIDTSQTDSTINSNYNTLFSLANASYTNLRNGFYTLDMNLFAAATDEAEQTSPLSSAILFNQGSWNASSNPDNFYSIYYAGIRAANKFIEHSVNYKTILGANRDTISAAGKVSFKND
ncbi:MAG TPA: hypothetical protein VJ720_12060, partial [Chitinophaga sp.]|nr:hypothetical protein [Chitinophaga sp.]